MTIPTEAADLATATTALDGIGKTDAGEAESFVVMYRALEATRAGPTGADTGPRLGVMVQSSKPMTPQTTAAQMLQMLEDEINHLQAQPPSG